MARQQFNAYTYNTKYANAVAKHYQNRLKAIFEAMYQEAAKIGKATGFHDPKKEFYLKDFPKASAKIDALLRTISGQVESLITEGTDRAWNLSYDKNHDMIQDLAERYGFDEARVDEWSKRNLASLAAFQQRRENGLNLSERVWDFMKHDKAKMELALEVGLAEGKSAQALSRDIRQYLNEPNKLFRRVRDKDGNLRLSKNAQAYHPGRGVYRSSYKNAMRVTRTEINMAYRTADFEAWNGIPFVTGQIIHLSASHPEPDICDELKGEYPKEFKFVGWHPHCLCYVTAKIPTREEMRKFASMTDAEQAAYKFEGQTTEMPQNFNNWLEDNRARIAQAKSTPYFIRDNFVGGDITKGLIYQVEPRNLPFLTPQTPPPTTTPPAEKQGRTRDEILAAAKVRQEARTPEQIYDIQDRWALRQDLAQYTPAQRDNFGEIEKALGVKRGFSMPYTRADLQSTNPNYGKGREYRINCQTCAPAYVMREWGFDIVAKGNTERSGNLSYYLSGLSHWDEVWLDPTGKRKGFRSLAKDMHANGWGAMTPERYKETLEKLCHNDGTYAITTLWKGGGGHATIIKRENGVLKYVEPQVNNGPGSGREWDNFEQLCKTMTAKPHINSGILRADNALVDIKRFASIFEPSKKQLSLHDQRIANEKAKLSQATTRQEVIALREACNSTDPAIVQMFSDALKQYGKPARTAAQEEDIRRRWIERTQNRIKETKTLDELRALRATWRGEDEKTRDLFIKKAKEIRIATRDAQAVQNTWNERRIKAHGYQERVENMRAIISKYGLDSKALDNVLAGELKFTKAGKCTALDKLAKDYEAQRLEVVARKTAENVANVASNTPWIDATDIDTLKAIKDVSELKKATKALAQKIAGINKDIAELEKTIPNAKTWAKSYTADQLHGVADAVTKKVDWIEANAIYYASDDMGQLLWKQKKYNQEITKLATDTNLQAQYSTWKVSQAVYTNKSATLAKEITELQQKQTLNQLAEYVKKYPNSAVLMDMITEAELAYNAGKIADFNTWADKAIKKANKLENDRKRNARKSAKSKTKPLGADFWGDSKEMLQFAKDRATAEGWGKAKLDKIQKLEEAIVAKDTATANEMRKDLAIWVTDEPFKSYEELGPQTAKIWTDAKTTAAEKEAIYAYTYTYHNINEPLRGLTYMGSATSKAQGERRIPLITDLLERTSLEHDMWFQRGDDLIGLKKFGIDENNFTDADILGLVGKTGNEGAFWSSGSAKGKGFNGRVIFNIYAPKGTKGMYVEPFSAYGNGACNDGWDGTLNQHSVSRENEYLFQRGTKFKVTKAEADGPSWGKTYYIDLEVIEQDVLPFPYVGDYPY